MLGHQRPDQSKGNSQASGWWRGMGLAEKSLHIPSGPLPRFAKEIELLRKSSLLDPVWYRQSHEDLRATPLDVARHYLEHGAAEGRNPSALFDTSFYLKLYPDVAASGTNPLVHYILKGAAEGRLANPLFDTKFYLGRNPDLGDLKSEALAHYLAFGGSERRDPHPLFSSEWYALKPSSIAEDGVNLLLHYLKQGKNGGRDPHPLFSTDYYLEHCQEARESRFAPLVHFLYKNQNQVNPNELFDNQWYLERNPDVRDAGIHPLAHFVIDGAKEGRDPSPGFSTKWYLAEYPDVDPAKINPLAHFLHYGKKEGRKPRPQPTVNIQGDLKALHSNTLELRLQSFLNSPNRLHFQHADDPVLSIVIVLFNKAHFTFACLESLEACLSNPAISAEIIIFDNNSTDSTPALLERCDNLAVIASGQNLGFLAGVNQASKSARGKYLLLLNNDTQVPRGTLEQAVSVLDAEGDVGAVGARLILPDGTLQEAGSIVWNDGSCLGYCRGRDPNYFAANFRRDVDYCSAAFLLTRAKLFEQLGRFNPIYVPAYYEETDYCIRLWENGYRVVYDPFVIIFHYEFGSAGARAEATKLQTINQGKFKALHEAALQGRFTPSEANIARARHAGPTRRLVLFIDDRVPHAHLGSGFPRAAAILKHLVSLGAAVTLLPTDDQFHSWDKVRRTLPPTVEVAFGVARDRLASFLGARRGLYDAVFVSRPHNMQALNEALERDPDLLGGARLIYDAEALFTYRDVLLRRLRGEAVSDDEVDRHLSEELQIARFASTILCVSPREQREFAKLPGKEALVLGHTLTPKPSDTSFEDRKDILFVGAIHLDDSPNADSLVWFIDEVLPIVRKSIAERFRFVIAGLNKSERVKQRIGGDVVALGAMDDLAPLYAQARIFVAPTRFAAGLPHKVHEAAAAGLPCVVTPLLADQLGWSDGVQLRVGGDVQTFADRCAELFLNQEIWISVRNSALEAVAQDCHPAKFSQALDSLFCARPC